METRSFATRRATVSDRDELIAFGKTEFTRTFGHLYTAQDLDTYLLEGYDPSLYEKWLSGDDYRIFLAHNDTTTPEESRIVGYVLCGPCTLPLENCGFDASYKESCREVKRLYVHPDFFGTKLSATLLQTALELLTEQGFAERVYLGVYSENPRAIKFYSKYGFEHIGEYGFVVGDAVDREFIFHWKRS